MEKDDRDPSMKGARMQGHAVSIEWKLRAAFNCDRFAMGGFVNSDHIRSGGFISAIVVMLSKYYFGEKGKLIDEYLSDILYYSNQRMDDIDEAVIDDILEKLNVILTKLAVE